MRRPFFLSLILVVFALPVRAQEWSVFSDWIVYSDAPNALYHHLAGRAFRQLDTREQKIAALKTRSDWQTRQAEVRRTLNEIVGPFPEKAPLNARVTGTLRKDGYRIEKVVFESMPGYLVTAALYLPEGMSGRTPAIIYCSGHSDNGFRSAVYQYVALNLVRKGFIVFAFDPVGQGERKQYEGVPGIDGPTKEHSFPGAQLLLAGTSLARYFVWDGIRAVDYLLTRPEVDPKRIGITGRSGGGTQAAYIAAFDERILAAAPENYITTFRRLLQTRGPQDAEQNFSSAIARGIDLPDLVEVRAPRPTLLVATTRDMFNIEGTREAFAEAQRAYSALGARAALRMTEDDAGHESTKKNREAMYAFFREAFGMPGSTADEVVAPLKDAELKVLPEGMKSRSTMDLARQEFRPVSGNANAVREAMRLSGYEAPRGVRAIFTGRHPQKGYSVEKYILTSEAGYPVPYLLLVPEGKTGRGPAVLYLDPKGKSAAMAAAEPLVRSGQVVLVPDLPGYGELAMKYRGDSEIRGSNYNLLFGAALIGTSLAGIQAHDITALRSMLATRPEVDPARIEGVAVGAPAVSLLHAAAFEKGFARVVLEKAPRDFASLFMSDDYDPALAPVFVPGALRAYDLPDLARAARAHGTEVEWK